MSPAASPRRDLMANAIMEAATTLFDERGYGETSLQDIADAIGVQRPSLYHYFKSKEEILLTLLQDVLAQNEASGLAGSSALSPTQRLSTMLANYAGSIAEDPARFRIVTRNEANLPPDVLAQYRRRRKTNWELLKSTIAEGMAAGELRPMDVGIAASTLHGAVTGMMLWFRPDRDGPVPDAVDAVVDLLVRGLQPSSPRDGAHTEGGVVAALRTARQALDYIETTAADQP